MMRRIIIKWPKTVVIMYDTLKWHRLMYVVHVGLHLRHLADPGTGHPAAPSGSSDATSTAVAPPWPSSRTTTPRRACPFGAKDLTHDARSSWDADQFDKQTNDNGIVGKTREKG